MAKRLFLEAQRRQQLLNEILDATDDASEPPAPTPAVQPSVIGYRYWFMQLYAPTLVFSVDLHTFSADMYVLYVDCRYWYILC